MGYPSYYKDNSFHSKNRYTHKHKYTYRKNSKISNNSTHTYTNPSSRYNINHSYLNNASRYNNDNNITFHGSSSSPNLTINQFISPTTTTINNNNGSNNKVDENINLTSIKKSRYQPHVSESLPNIRSRYNVSNSTSFFNINKTISKSRYDPTNKTSYHSHPYNNNSANNINTNHNINYFNKTNFDKYRTPCTLSNRHFHNNNNNNISSSFNQYRKLNRPANYKKKSNDNNYTNRNRISKFSTFSSITHSYVKPQAKRVHNLTITTDGFSGKPIRSVLEQSSKSQNNISVSNLLDSDIGNDSNNSNINNNNLLNKENSIPLSESDDDTIENNSMGNTTYDQLKDFEHINNPALLVTKLSDLNYQSEMSSYPKNTPTYNKYVFPLNRLQNKLWYLKYSLKFEKCNDIKEKSYITSLSQYSFYQRNISNNKLVRNCMNWLLKNKCLQLKTHLVAKKHQCIMNQIWIKQCKEIEHFDEIRKQKERQCNTKLDSDCNEVDDIDNDTTISSNRFNGRARINRADYVNDDELEDIMCQIDPGYRYNKQAAVIPMMLTDTLRRNSMRFKDVNNLNVDKDKWAIRLVTDTIDTFTKEEHDSFIKGYLRFPKKFGKISDYMGKLRSPEECVLHYYRTKKIVDYKALIKKRNMDRIKARFKSVKKNQDDISAEESSDEPYMLDVEAMIDEDCLELAYEKEMEEEGLLDSDS